VGASFSASIIAATVEGGGAVWPPPIGSAMSRAAMSA
jgi:hypothetical protein